MPFNKEVLNINEPVKITKSAIKVLESLKENQKYTIDELSIKLDLSREIIKRALKQLRECKIIE